jgi:cytochrome c556
VCFRRPLQLILPAVLLMHLAACHGSDPMRAAGATVVRDDELHALMATQVDVLMARIQTLAFDQNRTVDELDQERRRQMRQLGVSAQSLQISAQGILQMLPALTLADEDVGKFEGLAAQMGDAAAQLEAAAARSELSAVSELVARLQGTCASCHQLYRGF